MIDYGTVEKSKQQIIAEMIFRQIGSSLFTHLNKISVSNLHNCDAGGCEKVKAKPEFDDGSNNCRIFHFAASAFFQFTCKIKTSTRIRLPEINSGTQPIVLILTFFE